MSGLTNAQLAKQVSDLLDAWSGFFDQYKAWVAGSATGGPNGDGRYPLAQANGAVVLVPCPAALGATVTGPADQAVDAKLGAEAAEANAAAHAANVSASATLVENAKTVSISARDAAILARDTAQTHQANASVYAQQAQAAKIGTAEDRDATEVYRDDAMLAAAEAENHAIDAAASAAEAGNYDPSLYVHVSGATMTGPLAMTGDGLIQLNAAWGALESNIRYEVSDDTTRKLVAGVNSGMRFGPKDDTNGDIRLEVYNLNSVATNGVASGSTFVFGADGNIYREWDKTVQFWNSANFNPTSKLNANAFTWANLSGKPTTFTPSAHSHTIADVTGLQTALDGKLPSASLTWANVSGKPTTFTPSSHTHVIADVTGLQTALDAKQAAIGYTAAQVANGAATHSLTSGDTRNSNSLPSFYSRGLYQEFKGRSVVGLPGSTTYASVLTLAQWNDASGGNSHQLAFNDTNGLYYRSGNRSADTWATWQKLWTDGNFDPALKLDVANLTWANVTGKPSFATVATSGSYTDLSNKPTLNYLPLTGGTLGSAVTPLTLERTDASTNVNMAFKSPSVTRYLGIDASGDLRFGASNNLSGTASTKVWTESNFDPATKLDALSLTWANVSGKPTTFTPSAHTHVIADVTSLQATLDAKLPLAGGAMTGSLTRSGQGAYLNHANAVHASAKVTVSTAAPSGGADGDIWLKI